MLSTNEVAKLLNVTETTIKRWADSGKLSCQKTLGGHRKYSFQDIKDFATKYNIEIIGTLPANLEKVDNKELEFLLYSKNYKKLGEIIFERALNGSLEDVYEMLYYFTKNQVDFYSLCDRIIFSCFVKVGELWEKGSIDIDKEHIISEKIRSAVIRLVPFLPHSKANNIKVLIASTEDQIHDMASLFLSFALSIEGCETIFLGARTPFNALIKAIDEHNPNFICISAKVKPENDQYYISKLIELKDFCSSKNIKIIAGGQYFNNLPAAYTYCNIVLEKIKDTFYYIKAEFNV